MAVDLVVLQVALGQVGTIVETAQPVAQVAAAQTQGAQPATGGFMAMRAARLLTLLAIAAAVPAVAAQQVQVAAETGPGPGPGARALLIQYLILQYYMHKAVVAQHRPLMDRRAALQIPVAVAAQAVLGKWGLLDRLV
jgi:hypothetical protein